MMKTKAPPLYCDAAALPEPERSAHFALARRLMRTARARSALPNGYSFLYPADALAEIALFIRNERKCCPFLTFELVLPAGEEVVALRMTGPTGAREVLDHEFSIHEGV